MAPTVDTGRNVRCAVWSCDATPAMNAPFSVGRRRVARILTMLTLAVVATFADAVEWHLTKTLSATETYSDNVNLAPRGSEQSDFITQVNPGFSLIGRGRRMNLGLTYTLQTYSYARNDNLNRVGHQLNANGWADVVPDVLSVDGRAAVSQQNISLRGPIGFDTSTDSANRAEFRTYAAGTTLRNRLGRVADYQLRYQRDHVGAQGLGSQYSDADTFSASLTNGSLVATGGIPTTGVSGATSAVPGGTQGYASTGLSQTYAGAGVGQSTAPASLGAVGRLGWGLFYNRQNIDYTNSSDARFETSTLRLSYGLTPRFALTGTGGYENNDYASTGGSLGGRFWTYGFAWRPSNLTSLDASLGQRYYGKTSYFNFSHRSRYFVWNAGYTEAITTTRSQFTIPQVVSVFAYLDQLFASQVPDPVERAQLVNLFIFLRGLPPAVIAPVNFVTNQVFLDKSLRASVAYSAGKTTTSAYLFRTTRDSDVARSTSVLAVQNDFSVSGNIRQTGGGANFNWQVAPKTTLNFDLGYTELLFVSNGQRDLLRFQRVGATYQFNQRTTGMLALRHNNRTSNTSSGYEENALTATVAVRF